MGCESAEATTFTVIATTPMLKKKASSECTVATRRMRRLWICTSESFEPLVQQRYDAMLQSSLAPGAQFD